MNLGAGGPEELGGVLVHADRLDARVLLVQVAGEGAGLVRGVGIGVDDLPQRGSAVVEGGLGGLPVVGDVLVYARDREVLVPVGGLHGDRGSLLGARGLGLAVGQGDLVVRGGTMSGDVLHGEGSVIPDIDDHRLPAATTRGHLVTAAQYRGVPGDTGIGVDLLLHRGQVLDPGAHIDA